MMPSKWNLARFISESEDEVKKALKSSEEFDKIKELIGIANEDDLAGETIQQAKILKVRCEIQVFTPVELLLRLRILQLCQ
jgi:DNA polymerase-3 subunit alpha